MEVEEEYINFELQEILEEFSRIRDAYIAFKSYYELQEETMKTEQLCSKRIRENVEKLSTTYILLERRYKSNVDKLQTENQELHKTIEKLKEQCDHLRLINVDNTRSDEQTYRLQDEIEVLKAQLVMQEEKHNEDVALLKQKHLDEIQRHKVLLQNAKQKPVSSTPKKRGRQKKLNEKNTSCFRWPQLDVERINDPFIEINEKIGNENSGTKKRKLFHEDTEATVDII